MHGDSIQPRYRGIGAPSSRPCAGRPPSEAQLRAWAAGLAPGRRRRIEEAIWITVDGSGRLRFQVRMRAAGRGARQWARTVDTFEQAVALRERFEAARRGRGLAELRGQQLARMRLEDIGEEAVEEILDWCVARPRPLATLPHLLPIECWTGAQEPHVQISGTVTNSRDTSIDKPLLPEPDGATQLTSDGSSGRARVQAR